MKKSEVKIVRLLSKIHVPKPWDTIAITLLSLLILIPVFIILHQNLIDPEWPYHLDRILLFVAITALVTFLLKAVKKFLFLIVIIYCAVLLYGTMFTGYGFKSVFEDYRAMIYAMSDNPNPQDIIVSKLLPFPNKSKVLKAIEYDKPEVRNFALMSTTKHFEVSRDISNIDKSFNVSLFSKKSKVDGTMSMILKTENTLPQPLNLYSIFLVTVTTMPY